MGGWPLVVYAALVVALVTGMMVVSSVLGERQRDRFKSAVYEAGIVATGSGRPRFSVKYYLVAMFFVIFDLEAAFIFAWAVSAREVGWPGYIEISVFVGVLLVALGYLWRCGALDWSATARLGRGKLDRTPSRGKGDESI